MSSSTAFLSAAEAAKRLGVSSKALRLYEERGLIAPVRNAAGWRAYGPREMVCAREIVGLRALGLSLAQVALVLRGDPAGLEPALAAHQANLEKRLHALTAAVATVRRVRGDLSQGRILSIAELARLSLPATDPAVAFELPWPWGGERFELRDVRAITYITGPLGSGKTRLATRLAETVPGAKFIGLDRLAEGGAAARARLDAEPALATRVGTTLTSLVDSGASESDALRTLLVALDSEDASSLVIDMVERGLDEATQVALITHLRRRGPGARLLFLLTRSAAILDLAMIGADEAVLFCPANHSPPMRVTPTPGTPGHEALASCLASPEVRARTEGMIALRPTA